VFGFAYFLVVMALPPVPPPHFYDARLSPFFCLIRRGVAPLATRASPPVPLVRSLVVLRFPVPPFIFRLSLFCFARRPFSFLFSQCLAIPDGPPLFFQGGERQTPSIARTPPLLLNLCCFLSIRCYRSASSSFRSWIVTQVIRSPPIVPLRKGSPFRENPPRTRSRTINLA